MKYLKADFYRLIALFTIFIIQFSILNSQDTWVRTYQPFGNDVSYEVEDIRICPDSGYAVIGTILIDDWDRDGFMMKTDSDGNLLWANIDSVDFIPDPQPSGFVVLEDGSFITAGNYYWSNVGNYLLKRNSQGGIEWTQQLDNEFTLQALELTNDENLITTGFSTYNTIFLEKLDLSGNLIWRETYLPDGYEYGGGYSVTQTSDNGYAITGIVDGSNNWDVLVLKTDANGDSLWSWTYDGDGSLDYGTSIIETNDQELFISGFIHGEAGILIHMIDRDNVCYVNYYYPFIWTVLENSLENTIIGRGRTHLLAFNKESGDTLWTSQLPIGYMGNGDRGFQLLDDGYICLGTLDSEFIVLTKTSLLGEITYIEDHEINPVCISKIECYPNPLQNSLNIDYMINETSNIKINLYNIKGQLVDNILNEYKTKGNHSFIWNNINCKSGLYLISIKTMGLEITKKIIIMK